MVNSKGNGDGKLEEKIILLCFCIHSHISFAWARKTDNGKLVNIMRGEEKLHLNVFVSEYIFINILGEQVLRTSAKVVIPLKI